MGKLASEIQYLPGVGPKRALLLQRELGITTFSDLIHLYPFRYIDRSGILPIADIRPDLAYVQVLARVVKAEMKGKRLSVIVADESGQLELVFFKGIRWSAERLKPGALFVFFGKPTTFGGRINLVHPEIDAPPQAGAPAAGLGTLTGVYTSTEALKNAGITGKVMLKLQDAALAACLPEIE